METKGPKTWGEQSKWFQYGLRNQLVYLQQGELPEARSIGWCEVEPGPMPGPGPLSMSWGGQGGPRVWREPLMAWEGEFNLFL